MLVSCLFPVQFWSVIWLTAFDRNHEYYSDGQLKPTMTENVASRSGTGSENLDVPSASQAEVVRNGPLDATHGLQYNLPSVSSYAFSSSPQPNATAYTYPQGNSQLQSLSPFSSLMVISCPFFCFSVD